jgi:hypothetical protein
MVPPSQPPPAPPPAPRPGDLGAVVVHVCGVFFLRGTFFDTPPRTHPDAPPTPHTTVRNPSITSDTHRHPPTPPVRVPPSPAVRPRPQRAFMRTSCEHVMSYHEHVHVTDVSHDVAAVKHIARPWWARSDEGLSAQWPAQWPAIMGPRKPTFFPPPFFFGPPFPKMEGFGLQTYFPRIGHDEPATIKFTRRSHHQVHQGGGVHTARSGRVSFSTCMYYNHCECRQ